MRGSDGTRRLEPNRSSDLSKDIAPMSKRAKFYITTAISYPNGVPHIGHAYEAIATDAIARFERADGKDVFFLTGTDEHGLKMKQTAVKEGLSPRALADRNSARFRAMAEALNLSNDDFIRTTEPRHYRSSEEIWRRMEKAGDIFLKKYAGWYSVRDEAYYNEGETTVGTDGVRVGPQGSPVEWTEEETYFFRLSAYQAKLLDYYEKNPDFILPPERRNEVVSFVNMGLEDLSVSRTTLDWGIPVPGAAPHVMYVWVDALTNYITAAGFPDEKAERWHYWPADVYVIGKDILRFHAVYWPAFLMSAGIALPKRVFSHGFVLSRGEKMSKSVGNVVDPFDLVKAYGVDQVRYFFLREVAFGQDGNYSPEAIANRINADLANDLGNLAQRSLSMIAKNCAEKVPEPGEFTDADKAILAATDALYAKVRAAMDRQAITKYLDAVWAVVADANRYFAAEEPWAKKKTDTKRMETILYVTAEVVRQIAILAAPVMPASAAKLLDLLSQDAGARSFAALGEKGRLAPGTAVPVPQGVFPRYVDPEEAAKAAASPAPKAKKGGEKSKNN
jgi:methionyl-tRNA synthetase